MLLYGLYYKTWSFKASRIWNWDSTGCCFCSYTVMTWMTLPRPVLYWDLPWLCSHPEGGIIRSAMMVWLKETVVYDKRISRPSPLFIHFNCCCSSPAGYEPLFTGHFYKSVHGFISQFISFNLRRWSILLIYIYSFFQKYAR